MKEILDNARERLKGYCRVCPVCDGRACAGEVPGMGGMGTASAFKANLAALAAHRFNMRLVHEVKEPQTGTTILGSTLSMTVLAATIGGASFDMDDAVGEQEYVDAIVNGWIGQGTLSIALANTAVTASSKGKPACMTTKRREA